VRSPWLLKREVRHRFDRLHLRASELAEAHRLTSEHIYGPIYRIVLFIRLCFPRCKIECYQGIGRPVHEARRESLVLGDSEGLTMDPGKVLDIGHQRLTDNRYYSQ